MAATTFKINRFYHPKTTIGEFWGGKTLLAYTIELPWRDNKRRVSCIPAGKYEVLRHKSPKFGDCYILANVPSRSGILIHVANDADDSDGTVQLQGCIAPVTWVRIGNGTVRGMESTVATNAIYQAIANAMQKGRVFLEIA